MKIIWPDNLLLYCPGIGRLNDCLINNPVEIANNSVTELLSHFAGNSTLKHILRLMNTTLIAIWQKPFYLHLFIYIHVPPVCFAVLSLSLLWSSTAQLSPTCVSPEVRKEIKLYRQREILHTLLSHFLRSPIKLFTAVLILKKYMWFCCEGTQI